ncbi:unnamed protein product [Arctogadus glacialis]
MVAASAAPRGLARGLCEWGDVTGPAPESLRGGERGRETEADREGSRDRSALLGSEPASSRSGPSPVARHPRCTQLRERQKRERKWKNPSAPDVDTTARTHL